MCRAVSIHLIPFCMLAPCINHVALVHPVCYIEYIASHIHRNVSTPAVSAVCVRARICVRARMCACVRMCVRACVHVRLCVSAYPEVPTDRREVWGSRRGDRWHVCEALLEGMRHIIGLI